MKWAENLLVYIVNEVLINNRDELKIIERDISKLQEINGPFPRLSYTECIELLKKGNYDIQWGDDFGSPEETYISAQYKKPVIVYGFPSKIKAFYMKLDNKDPKLALGMDLIAPEGYGEIIGGGERETDYNLSLIHISEPTRPY